MTNVSASLQYPDNAELEQKDIEWALTQMDGVIDVSEQDLLNIYRLASGNAAKRAAK